MRTTLMLALTLSTPFLSPEASGATWYVAPPPLGSNKNPGSQQEPFAAIQRGIDAATDADTVIVAEGTYVENIHFSGKNIVLRSTNPTDWAVVKQTIIDGNKSGSVVTLAGTENETCILSGFTVRNGTGTSFTAGWYGQSLGGGGIFAGQLVDGPRARAAILNNIITANVTVDGGGIFCCDGLIQNNIIVGNSAGTSGERWHGGGMVGCHGIIQNNLIAGNIGGCGGAVSHSNAVFRNNIVVGNVSTDHGGGLAHIGTSDFSTQAGSIVNCIVWANTAPNGAQLIDCVAPTSCCIQDWTGGGSGNISLDPRFVDPDGPDDDADTFEDNDYHLLRSSSCIDAGTNEGWMNGATDLDGKPRILLGATSLTVDIGAYEYRFDFAIAENAESNMELSWTMLPMTSYRVLSSFDMTAQPWTEETTMHGGKTGGRASWIDPAGSSAVKYYKLEIE